MKRNCKYGNAVTNSKLATGNITGALFDLVNHQFFDEKIIGFSSSR
jgi:hypothetical protein